MAASMCVQQNCTEASGLLYEIVVEDMWKSWEATVDYFDHTPWLLSLLGSTMVGLTGIFPLMIIPIDGSVNLHSGA